MARRLRVDVGGVAYHVINRRVGRMELFEDDADYAAFEKVLAEAQAHQPMRVVAYCLMPSHWHLVLWPRQDGTLSRFMQWLTVTHMRRWHAHRATAGTGPLYQGRFKSFPIQQDGHFLTVCRYVERNPVRAGLVKQAQQWRWCSLYQREHQREQEPLDGLLSQARWPVQPPADWTRWVNRAETHMELEALRRSVNRGAPFGQPAWQARTATRLGLTSSLRDPWRPKRRHEPRK